MQLSHSLRIYCQFFENAKKQKFYNAWCDLEQVEISNGLILRNHPSKETRRFLNFLQDRVRCFQALFPYNLFLSPEMKEGQRLCNICGKDDNPWSDCEHIPGQIYCGVLCVREIRDVTFLGAAITTNPVQKYSVLNVEKVESEKNSQKYAIVRSIVDLLDDPFESWNFQWTKRRHPHQFFSHIDGSEQCPCGSGHTYRDCCLSENGVLRPHIDFIFHERDQVPMSFRYVGYK